MGIILLCLLLAGAGVAVASVAGLINIKDILGKMPLANSAASQNAGGTDAAAYNALKQENSSLKQQVAMLQKEVALSQGGQPGMSITTLGITTLAGVVQQQATFKDLAGYYGSMKPAEAVAILNNLDPQMTAGILHAMDKDQAGQILAAMDPAQAARAIGLIAAISNAINNQANNLGTGATP
ncbi:MAG: hypothetical protein ABSC17_01225 [Thermacetogeniaceae bacterium]